MQIDVTLPRVFKPLEAPARYKGIWGGRGSGKSHNRAEALILDALENRGLRAVCIREVQKTLKESSKRLLEDKLSQFRLGEAQGFKIFNEVIQTPGDGIFTFQGMQDHNAESIKSLEGFDRAWIEEAQTLSTRSLSLLRPTIRAEGSEIWATWNPRRKNDPVDELLRGTNPPTNSIVIRANWSDNPFFPSVLEQERLDCLHKTPDQYEHIWEGGYATVNEGAYFVRELQNARKSGRITRITADPLLPIRLFADIGGTGAKADAFVFWAIQCVGREIRVLDYYEVQGQPIQHHLHWLRERNYTPGTSQIWLPHDGATQDKVFAVSYESAFRTAGYETFVVPNQGKGAAMQRIEAARRWLPACWFNAETTQPGLDALGWYHEKKDPARNIGLGPDHDWSSHGCFVGETKVLTRYGMCRIMSLPKHGEVMTTCGWKKYINPRITRKNARLVEVRFKDGYTVKCTPDHLFKTVNGWISAENLTEDTAILSTSTKLHSISTAVYTVCGRLKDIYRKAAVGCTGTYGGRRLVRYLRGVTYTIKTVIYSITDSIISNVYRRLNILGTKTTNLATTDFQTRLEIVPPIGTDPRKVGYGTNDTQKEHKVGLSGDEKISNAHNVIRFLKRLLERVGILRYIARVPAKRLLIESVREINETADVWCITVPEAGEFSLENGAVVHNCDAFGLMCVVVAELFDKVRPNMQQYQRPAGSWMG